MYYSCSGSLLLSKKKRKGSPLELDKIDSISVFEVVRYIDIEAVLLLYEEVSIHCALCYPPHQLTQ